MSNLNESNNADSNHIKTGWIIAILVGIALVVVGFYVFNFFHKGLSVKNEVWGTFGDYIGGILNPVIAAFAFYLIAKTYELQKRELNATRSLLEVSTNAQKDQIKLAALTALLNSNLMRIDMLNSERNALRAKIPLLPDRTGKVLMEDILYPNVLNSVIHSESSEIRQLIDALTKKVSDLQTESTKLEKNIKQFLSSNTFII